MDFNFSKFLRDGTGGFDLPALLVSLFFCLGAMGGILQLVKASRSGRMRFVYSGQFSRAIAFDVERASRPCMFWFLVVLYSLLSFIFLVLAFLISFGLLRKL